MQNIKTKVEGMTNIWEFIQGIYIFQVKSIDDYIYGNYSKRRAFVCWAQNIIMWINAIRFILLLLFKNHTIDLVLGNYSRIFNRAELLTHMIALWMFSFAFYGKINLNSFKLKI